MPSRQEGFGVVYAEAMWHGLPCIGSTADAAGQVIKEGETGLLVSYGDRRAIADAVAWLLADPARARAMGEAGRRRAPRGPDRAQRRSRFVRPEVIHRDGHRQPRVGQIQLVCRKRAHVRQVTERKRPGLVSQIPKEVDHLLG